MVATVTGLREVRRALRRFPQQANAELKEGSQRLANRMVSLIRASAASVAEKPRQAALAARDVRIEQEDGLPIILAGGGDSKASRLVFGTEFGAKNQFGWFSPRMNPNYYNWPRKQFPRHRGRSSYWFHKTVDENHATIDAEAAQMASDLVARWSA